MNEETLFVPITQTKDEKPKDTANDFISRIEDDGEMFPKVEDFVPTPADQVKPMPLLTEKEKQALYLVRRIQYLRRYSPSCSEIAKILGVNKARGKTLIGQLVRKGYLEWEPGANWVHKRILYPKGIMFPWEDYQQFPEDLFIIRKNKPVH